MPETWVWFLALTLGGNAVIAPRPFDSVEACEAAARAATVRYIHANNSSDVRMSTAHRSYACVPQPRQLRDRFDAS